MCVFVYIHVFVCMCMCVCMCAYIETERRCIQISSDMLPQSTALWHIDYFELKALGKQEMPQSMCYSLPHNLWTLGQTLLSFTTVSFFCLKDTKIFLLWSLP